MCIRDSFISLFYMLRTSLRADICPQVQPNAHLVNGHWVGISNAHTVPCGPHNGAGFLFIPDLTNKATMGQQYVIKRRLGPVTPAPAAGGDGGSGPGGSGARGRPAASAAVVA